MTIIFFTLPIRWETIAAKNASFYNHIPVFNCKITIEIILFFIFMRPTVPFSYFCSNTAECQIITSNEISFDPKMNKTWKSSIRKSKILNYSLAGKHKCKHSQYNQAKIVPISAFLQVCFINLSYTRISCHVTYFTSMLLKSKSFSKKVLWNHSNKMGSVNTEGQ